MLRAETIAKHLSEKDIKDPFILTPEPCIKDMLKSGSSSIDLRLGCWFKSLKKANINALFVDKDKQTAIPSTERYVTFGSDYFLHPGDFVLAVTLEWIRMPKYLAGYIHGKSSWGRRGLIVATAAVIHPGFKGCITLELTNLGEVPIAIKPGMRISQLCLHDAPSQGDSAIDKSSFSGQRKPQIGTVKLDRVAEKLMEPMKHSDDLFQ